MRFTPGGPWLPDELLTARDEGDVLFFCGSGVSRASAGLQDFAGLARDVLGALGSASNSPARTLFNAARSFEDVTKLTGLVATDRIFGMLEREFDPRDVRAAVATALKPKPGSNLAPHRSLLDLSTDSAGGPRLVTTNFDRLFEDCVPTLPSHTTPRLPDPSRPTDFQGVVHLHGCVDSDYQSAQNDMFVLSSADFGHAYLADGWATRYLQALLDRFQLVFVGYSADDPPVQYLLEALNRYTKRDKAVYALQSGDAQQALAQWSHKGVTPISYSSDNRHSALWATLAAWAERARDVDKWYDDVLTKAAVGPEALEPHERGAIRHLASHVLGTERMVSAGAKLPASWLYVLDARTRYMKGGVVADADGQERYFNPFEAFGLDSDDLPPPDESNNLYKEPLVPASAWSAFAPAPRDQQELPDSAFARFLCDSSSVLTDLPHRLNNLGNWLVSVAHQPAALWWAARQVGLHPLLHDRIEWRIRQQADQFSPGIREGWHLLYAASKELLPSMRDQIRYNVEDKAKSLGWRPALLREYARAYEPILSVKATRIAKPPLQEDQADLASVLHVSVDYPTPHEPIDLPDDSLAYAVGQFRRRLENAIQLYSETRGNDHVRFNALNAPDGGLLDTRDSSGIDRVIAPFLNMMTRLAAAAPELARAELSLWKTHDVELFRSLCLWAAARPALTSPEEAALTIQSFSDEEFWSHKNEADVLFVLAARWGDLSPSAKTLIERRLLGDSFAWANVMSDRDRLIASHRLNWLHHLSRRGVNFSFNFDEEFTKLKIIAGQWSEDEASEVGQSRGTRSLSLQYDNSAGAIGDLPLSSLIDAAKGIEKIDFHSRIVRIPLSGLSDKRPHRLLSAITSSARFGSFEPTAWGTLLSSNSQAALKPKLCSVIALRLARLEPKALAQIEYSASSWMLARRAMLKEVLPDALRKLWAALIAALTEASKTSQPRKLSRDWLNDSGQQPAGHMVETLLGGLKDDSFQADQGLPDLWREWLNELLQLPGDARAHAASMLARRLRWLYWVDPTWTSEHVLPLAYSTGSSRDAFWAGFIHGASHVGSSLALNREIGTQVMEYAQARGLPRDFYPVLAGFLISAWAGKPELEGPQERLHTDEQIREVLIHADENLRTAIIWQLDRASIMPNSQFASHVIPFLRNVWPRQLSVRSPKVSSLLADLALSVPNQFREIVDIILPMLVPARGAASIHAFNNSAETQAAIDKHPQHLLSLLWALLSEKRSEWPHGIEKLLTRLADRPDIKGDLRLAALLKRARRRS